MSDDTVPDILPAGHLTQREVDRLLHPTALPVIDSFFTSNEALEILALYQDLDPQNRRTWRSTGRFLLATQSTRNP